MIAHIIGSLIVGAFGASRKIGFGEAFVVSLLFSEFIAIICVYSTPSKYDKR